MIGVSSAFDGGNIEVHSVKGGTLDLAIRPDNASDFFQWFYFRVTGARDTDLTIKIRNASDAAYPDGFKDYRVCASYDRQNWARSDTEFDGESLQFQFTPDSDCVYFAYFAPYSWERHLDLVSHYASRAGVDYQLLGRTLQDRSMDCLSVGQGVKTAWIIARQHPGETMAEWWMEGFLDAICSDDKIARALRQRFRFHIVPNMNPDGGVLGNLRTNAAGANLNREWNIATVKHSPEVLCVRNAMDMQPPDICLDVHGDEALPYNFIAGGEGVPRFDKQMQADLDTFKAEYVKSSKEFQIEHGYAVTAKGKANLGMCTNYTAETYGCLAMTLEMPFKDNANRPDADQGWSPERARQLGRDTLPALLAWARTKD